MDASSAESPRIKRNTACTSCRDSKVKCTAALSPSQPCTRCAKLQIACVVDKSHKRTTRRSKLEQLEKEVQSIRDAVRTKSLPAATASPAEHVPAEYDPRPPPPPPPARTTTEPTPLMIMATAAMTPTTTHQPFGPFPGRATAAPPLPPPPPAATPAPEQVPTPSQSTYTTTTPTPLQPKRLSEARALGSRVFTGEDIDHYFDQYFDHFHPYFPVLRLRDPDKCYRDSPFLFWVVVYVAATRYPRDGDALAFLVEHVAREAPALLAAWPLGLAATNALLILCAWPLPTVRVLSDPSLMYAPVALAACMALGLHTGSGGHREFPLPLRAAAGVSDEEARHTWAGANIITQRVHAYSGLPCFATLFNQPLDQQRRQGPPADFLAYFEILLEAQKFSARVSRTMFACTEAGEYISEQTVRMLEDEYDIVEQTLRRSQTDLDLFTLLAVRLEIQTYYFCPAPTADQGALRRNLARAYNTARALLELAARLEAERNFLAHAPHHVFRTVLEAAAVAVATAHSVHRPDGLVPSAVDALVRLAAGALRACSVKDGDLATRSARMMESYWSLRHLVPALSVGMSRYRRRVGAVVVWDCLKRWKTDLEEVNKKAGGQGVVGPEQAGVAETATDPNILMPGPGDFASLQDIDWNSLVMDFDWTNNDMTYVP